MIRKPIDFDMVGKKVRNMLRNYAHHAQSPKSSVHSVDKMQGKAI
jgi:hypothetical protein